MTRRQEYDKYDDYLRVGREQRRALEAGVAAIVKALKDAGVSWGRGREPMSDVNCITLDFLNDGDFRTPEVALTGMDAGCYTVVCLEPYPAEEIADDMIDAVIHDNDLLDLDRDLVKRARANLASALAEPLDKEGDGLFAKEFVETFSIGEDAEVDAILAAHPCLRPAHDVLERFFEDVQ